MKRQDRLRRNNDFQRVRREGKSHASPRLVLAFLQNELAYSRFGFVVSKRLGKAVRRNKIKRRMREAIRLQIPYLKPGFDLVLIARQPVNQASYAQIEQDLVNLLTKSDLWL